MKILLITLITLGGIQNLVSENVDKGRYEQRILLRKLKNFKPNPGDDTRYPTWNDVVADSIVNQIFPTSNMNKGDPENIQGLRKGARNFISEILVICKIITDIFANKNKSNDANAKEPAPEFEETFSEEKSDYEGIEDFDAYLIRDEVELVDPVYHGRLKRTDGSESHACPDGTYLNESGKCVVRISSKFILSVPSQCPIGYRRDRLGFCRMYF